MTNEMQKRGITVAMADRFGAGMDAAAFERTLMATVMPQGATREQVASFLMVCNQHGLNPFTREVYAFPDKGGGIRPIVSIDGWATLANNHPQYDGCTLTEIWNESGALVAVEAAVYRKDRSHPMVLREYLSECKRSTDPWNRWPARMLRHKAFIQAIRLAFSFSGITDEDEVEREQELPRRATAAVTPRVRIEDARVVAGTDPAGGSPLVLSDAVETALFAPPTEDEMRAADEKATKPKREERGGRQGHP